MIFDNNLIAYEYYKMQYVPKPVYESGSKDNLPPENRYEINKSNLAVLTLDKDIINSQGFGLKKGFYNVSVDKYMDFLLIFQSGKIKAKVPVLKTTVLAPEEPYVEKPKKMSYSKYKKLQEKEYRKYLSGENPAEFDYKSAQILQGEDENSYILIYNSGNIEYVGVMRF